MGQTLMAIPIEAHTPTGFAKGNPELVCHALDVSMASYGSYVRPVAPAAPESAIWTGAKFLAGSRTLGISVDRVGLENASLLETRRRYRLESEPSFVGFEKRRVLENAKSVRLTCRDYGDKKNSE
uniref:Uncharacterized protein n=1 Tax=Vespula pensylvanica TaxID=30213 RepID=A0A834UEC8_VESPE|nr:hypothetical protein H0235_002477 [Vespula pensylvanica]